MSGGIIPPGVGFTVGGPSTLAEALVDLEAAHNLYDLVVAAQHQAISERNLANARLAQIKAQIKAARPDDGGYVWYPDIERILDA